MQIDPILDLVKTVEGFQGRVSGALQLAHLQRQNQLPQVTPAAFVVPAGLAGGAVASMAGAYRQLVEEQIAVVIIMRSADDPRASRALDPLAALCMDVITTLSGVRLGGAGGQIQFIRGNLVSLADGAAVYQLEFRLADQLRLAR